MLDNLMRYLEVALPRMRDEASTLEREGALIEAFLNVQKIRMGRRLAFEIDIPAGLRSLYGATDDAAHSRRECPQARPQSAARGRLRADQRAVSRATA